MERLRGQEGEGEGGGEEGRREGTLIREETKRQKLHLC